MKHADFYATAATVIPVLYAILLFQTHTLVPGFAHRNPVRRAVGRLVVLAFVVLPLLAKTDAMYALYINKDLHAVRLIVFLGFAFLLMLMFGAILGYVMGEQTLRGVDQSD